jgi:Protein kinase domain
MGRVYKVRQPHLERLCALKLLPPGLADNPAWVERFTREALALARLNHPGIVQVYDFGEVTADGDQASPKKFPFLLMEYVDGVNLRQALRAGSLTAAEALAVVPAICAALQYAHEQGVLHRDIKPENILLDADGRVKIADFGVAKLAGGADVPGAALTATGAQLGTAAYMAPEQIERPQDVDHRADIYSLGVVFYELLTGELPLGRFPAPSEKAGTDPRLDTIVFRTLEKERERRFQSAGEVKLEVEHVSSSEPPPMPSASADVPVASTGPSPQPTSRKTLALVLSLLVLPFVLVALIQLWPMVAHSGYSRTSLMLGVLGFILAGAALVVFAFTWLFRRLQRAGLSTALVVVIVAIGLLVIPPIGCVALLVPAFVSYRSARAATVEEANRFQLKRTSFQRIDQEASADWSIYSQRPLWVTVRYRDDAGTIVPTPATGGGYNIGIYASITRGVAPNRSRLSFALGNGRSTNVKDVQFDDPPDAWFGSLFAGTVHDGQHVAGQFVLMQIGDSPVTLHVATEPGSPTDEFSSRQLR